MLVGRQDPNASHMRACWQFNLAQTQKVSSAGAALLSPSPHQPALQDLTVMPLTNVPSPSEYPISLELMSLEPAAIYRVEWMNEMSRQRDTPEGRARAWAYAQEVYPIMRTPKHLLSPDMQEFQRAIIEGGQHYSCITGAPPEELAEGRKKFEAQTHRRQVHQALAGFPVIRGFQWVADKLLDESNDGEV